MKKRYIALGIFAVLGLGAGTAAFVAAPTIHEGAPGEVPELGRFGPYTVGTVEQRVVLANRITFGKLGMASGQTEVADRELDVRLYYPAASVEGGPVRYVHEMDPPAMEPFTLEFGGRAYPESAPVNGETFPLVIMSHGFNGWNTQMSNLAEHIASRGYVVASIDHRDMKLEGVTDFVHSFALVLANRALDQRQVLEDLLARRADGDDPMLALIDPEQIGLIGYSMGGYGALANVGADYDYDSGTFAGVPSDALAPVRALAEETSPFDAAVTFAPWGGAPDNRVWREETLAAVNTPVLLIAGDQDDVSDYENGIAWIFEGLSGSERHLLTYREARHNIVGNAFALPEDAPFRLAEFLNEPVWRQDRINGINQHFVTAFLDLHLKDDEAKRAYLDVPASNANDSQWEIGFGEQLNGKFAGDDEAQHWRGFQRRWTLGLELQGKQPGE